MKTLRRFFDDIHRIANVLAANPMRDTVIRPSPEWAPLLSNLTTRRKPKKAQPAA